jgi:hypothetical protein
VSSGASKPNLLIEFVNESSNVINQVTSTGSVTITGTAGLSEYWKSYHQNDSAFNAWPAGVTTNGVANARQWLAPQTNFI